MDINCYKLYVQLASTNLCKLVAIEITVNFLQDIDQLYFIELNNLNYFYTLEK